jgi:ribosome-associated protein
VNTTQADAGGPFRLPASAYQTPQASLLCFSTPEAERPLPSGPHRLKEHVIESKQLAAAAAHLADLKKALDIKVYDVGEQIKVADWFVVVSAPSRPHVKAVTQELHVRLKAIGERHTRAEGAETGWWVLLDYGDVVVHILQPEAREFYEIDQLYGDCEVLDWAEVELPELPEPQNHR